MESVGFVAGKLALLEGMQVRISVLESKVSTLQEVSMPEIAVALNTLFSQVKTLQDVIVAQEQSIVDLIEAVQAMGTRLDMAWEQIEVNQEKEEFFRPREAEPIGTHEGECRQCERVSQISDASDLCEGCMIEVMR